MDAHTNGHTTGASATDATLDTLYSWWPAPQPAARPLPEAALSITIKGFLDGHETLLTARGMTVAEFTRNLQAIKGVLDPAPAPMAPQEGAAPQCPTHGALRQGKRGWFCPRKLDDGSWCKGHQ